MGRAHQKCVRLQEAAEGEEAASPGGTAGDDASQHSGDRVSPQGLGRRGAAGQSTGSQGPIQGLGSADVMPTEEQLPGRARRREAAKTRPVKYVLSPEPYSPSTYCELESE